MKHCSFYSVQSFLPLHCFFGRCDSMFTSVLVLWSLTKKKFRRILKSRQLALYGWCNCRLTKYVLHPHGLATLITLIIVILRSVVARMFNSILSYTLPDIAYQSYRTGTILYLAIASVLPSNKVSPLLLIIGKSFATPPVDRPTKPNYPYYMSYKLINARPRLSLSLSLTHTHTRDTV